MPTVRTDYEVKAGIVLLSDEGARNCLSVFEVEPPTSRNERSE